MFARRLNELRITVHLAPIAPLLVKEGRHHERGDTTQLSFNRAAPREPARPRLREGRGYGEWSNPEDSFDMAFVWTQTAAGPHFYLPGSSLRGALRSAAERLIGRWRPEWVAASAPFKDENLAQGWVLRQREQNASPSTAAIYRMAGPIERCFGHTALRGRWQIADAMMRDDRQAQVVVRDGVGIDRQTGAARAQIKFMFEAITSGEFETTITLINYELWQLGMLAFLLAELDGGMIRLGYGTRRGLGRVRVAATDMRFRWYGVAPKPIDGGVLLPTLAELARRAYADSNNSDRDTDYSCRDKDIALTLPLEPDADAPLGNGWRLAPARVAAADGFAPTDWDSAPWPDIAGTLPTALSKWELPIDLRPAGGQL